MVDYLHYENVNHSADFRQGGDCGDPGSDISDGCWNTNVDGTQTSVSLWHEPTPKINYWLRWAEQELDSLVAVRFDLDPIGIAENGLSSFDAKSTAWSGRVNFRWARAWDAFAWFRINESDGNDLIAGPTYVNDIMIGQDFHDVEAGVTYSFASNLYLGGRLRFFDYDDLNDRLDYDGEIFTLVAGMRF